MLDRPSSDRVSAIVSDLLAKRGIARPVADDDDLHEAGLTSLDMVNLMLAVEDAAGLKIPERDMRPANFRTMRAIRRLIGALKQAD
jgi:acyl carrier protein